MFKFLLDSAGMLVSDGSSLACLSPMVNFGLRWGMSVLSSLLFLENISKSLYAHNKVSKDTAAVT